MPTSIWLYACFDGFHYGHVNAVRQSLYLIEGEKNPRIVVGVHQDEEIIKSKGPPLFDETERYNLIRACRWVDEVIEDIPYAKQIDIIQRYNIDFVVHGDDLVVDGKGNDSHAAFIRVGKYKEVKRTEGISTTSLIERILRPDLWALEVTDNERLEHLLDLFVVSVQSPFPVIRYEHLISEHDCNTLRQAWPAPRKVIYLGGSWDCFGIGHVELLSRAKKAAAVDDAFLIVGVWSNEVLHESTGGKPLLTLLERALAVVQCKYSDALMLSPPKVLPPWIVRSLGIEMIVNADTPSGDTVEHVHVEEPPLHSVASLSRKLSAQRDAYEERQKRKAA